MPLLTEEELKTFPEVDAADVIPNHVARYWDLVALAGKRPAKVIGATGVLRDRPGFEVDFVTRGSASDEMHVHDRASVLMPVRGHWRSSGTAGRPSLPPATRRWCPGGLRHGAYPSMSGEAALYHVVGTDDPGGPDVEGLTPQTAIRLPYAIHTLSIRG
jgi:hypothetical protein